MTAARQQRASASRRSIAARSSGSRRGRDGDAGDRTTAPSRTMRPAVTSRSIVAAAVAGCCVAVDGRRTAQGTDSCGAGRGQGEAVDASGIHGRDRSGIDRCGDVVSEVGRGSRDSERTVKVEARAGSSASVGSTVRVCSITPRAAATCATRSGVWRRREIPRGGMASRTTPPTTRSEPDARRRTKRSPGEAAIGVASRTMPATSRQGSSIASPTASAEGGVDGRGPDVDPGTRSGRAAAERAGRGRGLWRRSRGSSVENEAAAKVRDLDAGDVERGAARTGGLDGGAVDLDVADPDGRSPGTSRSVAPRAREPPRSVPVTTAPRPLTEKTRSIARRTGPSRRLEVGCEAPDASIQLPRAPPRRRSSPVPRPPTADTARIGDPASERSGEELGDLSRRPRQRGRHRPRSAFVTTASPTSMPSASSSSRCSSVCARGPSSAATTSIAASISPAPTSMLPTSRSWPGHVDEVELRPVGAESDGRSRRRSSSPAAAPRAAGRRRCRSAPGAASSCRGRCGRPSRRRRSSGARRTRRAPPRRRRSAPPGRVVGPARPFGGRARRRPCSIRPMTAGSPCAEPRPASRRHRGRDRETERRRASRPAAIRRRPSTSLSDDRTRAGPVRERSNSASARRPGGDRPAPRSSARPGSPSSPGPPGTGRASPRRAASVTLSGRIARASGSRRIRAIEVGPADDAARPAARRRACRR